MSGDYLYAHKDPTAGFVGYTRAVLEQLDFKRIKFVGYAFQIEMKYKIWRKEYNTRNILLFLPTENWGFKNEWEIIWEALSAVLF